MIIENNCGSRAWILRAVLAGALWLAAGPIGALEACQACKHLECLKDNIRYNYARAAAYDGVAAELAVKIPAQVRDVSGMSPENRSQIIAFFQSQYAEYVAKRDGIEKIVAGVSECGQPARRIEATTTDGNCEINRASLDKMKSLEACQEIADGDEAHEQFHRTECLARKVKTYSLPGNQTPQPALVQSMAAVAGEEATAHRRQAAALQQVFDRLKNNCKLSFVNSTSFKCNMVAPSGDGAIVSEVTVTSGEICGAPDSGRWSVKRHIESRIVGKGMNMVIGRVDDTDDLACWDGQSAQAAQEQNVGEAYRDAGTMICYFRLPSSFGAVPQMWIRNFPQKMCKGAVPETVMLTIKATEGCP